MNLRNPRGQTFPLLLIVMPVMILLIGICFRSGFTALIHQKVQRLADQRTLDILEIQGKALTNLGRINPYARTVIEARRVVDVLIYTSVLTPELVPVYLRIQNLLKKAQKLISFTQKTVKIVAQTQVFIKMHEPLPHFYEGKVKFTFPEKPTALAVKDEPGYEGETGAPQVLAGDFSKKQNVLLKATILSEKFLIPWAHLKKQSDHDLESYAQIEMSDIEEKWTAQIREKTAL